MEGFNLDSFLNGLDTGMEAFDDLNFHDYVKQTGKEIRIFLDPEKDCYNSDVFDWLVEQFIPVMTSRYLKVESVKMDIRDGNSCWIAFTDKEGNQITVDDPLARYLVYETYGSLTQTD